MFCNTCVYCPSVVISCALAKAALRWYFGEHNLNDAAFEHRRTSTVMSMYYKRLHRWHEWCLLIIILPIAYPPYDCEYCFELLVVLLGFLARPFVLSSDPRLILVVVGVETSIAFWDELIPISSTALIHHLQSLYNVFICYHQRRPRGADIFHTLSMAFVLRQHNQILTSGLSLVRVFDNELMKTRNIDKNAES